MDATPPPADPNAPPAAEKPKGLWGTILTATPVALTALATAFAGLSSSEMTQAMYHRSLAAQHQSRAGDQWAFFQAKRIRGSGIESALEVLQALGHPEPFSQATVAAALARMEPLGDVGNAAGDPGLASAVKTARDRFAAVAGPAAGFALPAVEPTPLPDPAVRAAYEAAVQAVRQRQTEAESAALVVRLSPEQIDTAIRLAEDDADRFDQVCEPVNDLVKQLRAIFRDLGAAVRRLRGKPGPVAEAVAAFDRLDAGFRAAAMDYEARRYRQEAAFNRRAAEAYEVRVRRSGIESDRHRERSKRFFYSMLLAQVGVTVSSLALAKAQRSWLWFFAAVVGVVSLAFTGYVYLSY